MKANAPPQPATIPPGNPLLSNSGQKYVRAVLFLAIVLLVCPVRYWQILSTTDNTWVFAMNHAAASGLTHGRDVVWTSGPLGYLTFPQDFGNNLVKGLAFQTCLWVVFAAAFASIFFWTPFGLANLVLFWLFLALSGPLYWANVYMGVENLMLACALTLLVAFRWRGGTPRLVTALVLIGLIPLIKLTGGLIAAGALGGFLVERAIRSRETFLREAALALLIPAGVFAASSLSMFSSLDAFGTYLRSSRDLVSGYTYAMSEAGDFGDLAIGAAVLAVVAALVWSQVGSSWKTSSFFLLLLAIPLTVSLKHGLVRADEQHLENFFGFAALAMALISLSPELRVGRLIPGLLVLLAVASRSDLKPLAASTTGARAIRLASHATSLTNVRNYLRSTAKEYPQEVRLEPEIRDRIGDSTVASLSVVYNQAAVDHLRLSLYPVVQRYSAFTPYLDGLNAVWVREKGPRFLWFDGQAIDGRDFWAETPAMWLEIYRWYDLAMLGDRNILLERRTGPRFGSLVSFGKASTSVADVIRIPAAGAPVFWTLGCPSSIAGQVRALLWRAPPVLLSVIRPSTAARKFRVIPSMLTSPILGNYLPGSLKDLAQLLQPKAVKPNYTVSSFSLEGAGLSSLGPTCELEFFTPVS